MNSDDSKVQRSPLRSVRIDDDLWNAALEAAKANGEQGVSSVIRRDLLKYVRATAKRQRQDAQQHGGGGAATPPPP